MCQLWREYYSDLAEEEYHPDKFNNDFKNHVDDFVQNIENSSFPKETLIPVSTDEIHNHVKIYKREKRMVQNLFYLQMNISDMVDNVYLVNYVSYLTKF